MQHENKVVQMPLDFELNDKDNIKTNSLKKSLWGWGWIKQCLS